MEEIGTLTIAGKAMRVWYEGGKVWGAIRVKLFNFKGELSARDLAEIKRVAEAGLAKLGR